jgi:hypothetical protein
VIRLAPLELPDRDEADLARLGQVSSVRLFVERARALDPSFTLDSRNAAAVAGLCLTLEGLPLALELAAARVRLVGAQALLDALDHGIDALGKGHRDLPARQRGLRAALDFTISLLDTGACALFVGLGAFADAWTIEQAGRVVGDETNTWEAMMLLLDLSLVRVRGDGRLTMPERVRSHARELLQASGREAELRDRHAELIAEMVEAFDLELFLDRETMLANVRSVVEEIEYAIAWARQHDSASHRRLLGASGSIFPFNQRQGPLADDIRRLSDDETCVDETSGCIFAARGAVEWSFGDRSQAPLWTARAVNVTARPPRGKDCLPPWRPTIKMFFCPMTGPGHAPLYMWLWLPPPAFPTRATSRCSRCNSRPPQSSKSATSKPKPPFKASSHGPPAQALPD